MIKTSFNVQEVLQSANDLLADIQGKRVSSVAFSHSFPLIVYKGVMVLVPQKYEWQPMWLHLYNPPPSQIAAASSIQVDLSIIIHGHPVGEQCYAKYLCHVYQYHPDGSEHPVFLKRWRDKWGTN